MFAGTANTPTPCTAPTCWTFSRRPSRTAPATYSGLCAFRALVPADGAPAFARRRAQTLWIGPGHHLVHYPISAGRIVNLVAFAPAGSYSVESWAATATLEEFLAEFDGWDARLVDLIRAAGTPGRWALLDRRPLPRWTYDAVTLLGDAAHPMFPFFGQGAAQSLEDAAVLAGCLAADLPARALRRYQALRIPRTARLQEVSHARSHVNHLPDGPGQRARIGSSRRPTRWWPTAGSTGTTPTSHAETTPGANSRNPDRLLPRA